MWSLLVVVSDEFRHHRSKMLLVHDDDVVEALAESVDHSLDDGVEQLGRRTSQAMYLGGPTIRPGTYSCVIGWRTETSQVMSAGAGGCSSSRLTAS
jgi:hypothetical protein